MAVICYPCLVTGNFQIGRGVLDRVKSGKISRQHCICTFWKRVFRFFPLLLHHGFTEVLASHEVEDGVHDAVGAGHQPGHLEGYDERFPHFTGSLIQ